MSYILDALRRAESDRERERGQVPGLHAHTLPGPGPARDPSQRRGLPWAIGGLMLLAGLGAGIWWAGVPREAATPAATDRMTVAPSPTAAPTDSAIPAKAVPSTVTAPAPAPAPALADAAIARTALPPVPLVQGAPAAPPAGGLRPSMPASAVEAPIPRLSDLPDSTRRELPKLAISGSVYSDEPASRFVIVNGEVLREGAKLTADLTLVEIRPRELVLRFKGQHFRQPV